ncbi:MAG: hypothetical protein DMG21_19865, partial [Acidobacteria bacterium]
MNANRHLSRKSTVAVAAGLGLIALGATLAWLRVSRAQIVVHPQSTETSATPEVRGLIEDWTMHHLAYPEPTDVYGLGKLQQDPRYLMRHLARRAVLGNTFDNGGTALPSFELLSNPLNPLLGRWPSGPVNTPNGNGNGHGNSGCHGPNCPVVDWGLSLGTVAAAAMTADTYPAKFTFDVNATPDCDADYVTMPVNVAGVIGAAASQTGTFSASGFGTTGT